MMNPLTPPGDRFDKQILYGYKQSHWESCWVVMDATITRKRHSVAVSCLNLINNANAWYADMAGF